MFISTGEKRCGFQPGNFKIHHLLADLITFLQEEIKNINSYLFSLEANNPKSIGGKLFESTVASKLVYPSKNNPKPTGGKLIMSNVTSYNYLMPSRDNLDQEPIQNPLAKHSSVSQLVAIMSINNSLQHIPILGPKTVVGRQSIIDPAVSISAASLSAMSNIVLVGVTHFSIVVINYMTLALVTTSALLNSALYSC